MSWSEEKAREWLERYTSCCYWNLANSLAALLREVDDIATKRTVEEQDKAWKPAAQVGRETTLAEVRRVVNKVRDDAPVTCAQILSRLEKL
jgi:hypothetical protein